MADGKVMGRREAITAQYRLNEGKDWISLPPIDYVAAEHIRDYLVRAPSIESVRMVDTPAATSPAASPPVDP